MYLLPSIPPTIMKIIGLSSQFQQIHVHIVTLLMNKQQTINKYVDLIKKIDKRKKASKLVALDSHPHQLLALTHTLFFKNNTQHKSKPKISDVKQSPVSVKPTLKTLCIDTNATELSKTKRKYQAYQEQMQKKYIVEKQMTMTSPLRQKLKDVDSMRQSKRLFLRQSSEFIPMLAETHTLIGRKNAHPHKQCHKSQHTNLGRKMCELDGSILHFDSSTIKPPAFRNMFHNRDCQGGKEDVYEFLKTTSPFTIKSKLQEETLIDNHSFVIRPKQASKPLRQCRQGGQQCSRMSIRQTISKSKRHSRLHRRERSSLINLRGGIQQISGWQFTEDN